MVHDQIIVLIVSDQIAVLVVHYQITILIVHDQIVVLVVCDQVMVKCPWFRIAKMYDQISLCDDHDNSDSNISITRLFLTL